MYATFRYYGGNTEIADALVEHQDDVKRIVNGIDGFKAYYLIKTGDSTVSLTVYEDESGAEESNRAAAAWVGENLPDMAGAAPQISAGEVVLSA